MEKKILIIDDSEEIRIYLKFILTDNYQLFLANDGQEGLLIARKELPDLILCDVMMPGIDGYDCCCELKKTMETSHIPVLMLTGKSEDCEVIKGLEAGADDYLTKPFNPDILRSKINNHIRNRILLKQSYAKQSLIQKGMESVCPEEPANEPFVTILVRLIEANQADAEFSVKRLAELVNMSQTSLYRKVKQITALSILELIRSVRLKRAAELLMLQRYSIQEVSEMVGYNDLPTFRKHFSDFFGTVPSGYVGR